MVRDNDPWTTLPPFDWTDLRKRAKAALQADGEPVTEHAIYKVIQRLRADDLRRHFNEQGKDGIHTTQQRTNVDPFDYPESSNYDTGESTRERGVCVLTPVSGIPAKIGAD